MSCTGISDDEYMVTAGNDAFLLDAETKEVRTVIRESYAAYDPENEVFMLNYGNGKTGHVPHRTLDEMIEIGRSYLED